jgi:hypothetical protein
MRIFKERYSESDKVCRCTGDNLKKTFNKNWINLKILKIIIIFNDLRNVKFIR